MPLAMAGNGQGGIIKHIGGSCETRRFLEELGFTQGSSVQVVSDSGGHVIVAVRGTRVAISREMALRIMI